MGNPWDTDLVYENCCGRYFHKECIETNLTHSTVCPWCRTDGRCSETEAVQLLRQHVRANRGWASFQLATRHSIGLGVPRSIRLAKLLFERSIEQLEAGDEWSIKMAHSARYYLAITIQKLICLGELENDDTQCNKQFILMATAAAGGQPLAINWMERLARDEL